VALAFVKYRVDWSIYASNGLVVLALLAMSSKIGLIFLASALCVLYFRCAKSSFWLSILLTGTFVFGFVSMQYHIPYLGKIAGLCSLVGLLKCEELRGIHRDVIAFGFIGWTLCIIGMSFICVPASDMGINKYGQILFGTAISILWARTLLQSNKVNLLEVAYLTAVIGLFYLNTAVVIGMGGAFSIAKMGVLRLYFETLPYAEQPLYNYQSVGNIACLALGFVMMSLTRKKTAKEFGGGQSIFVAVIAAILIYVSGARQSYLIGIIMLAFALLGLSRKIELRSKLAMSVGLICILVILYGAYVEQVSFVTSVVEGTTNRASNFQAAIDIIREKPMWGVGLGNYYVPSYSHLGFDHRQFAHNMFLELLTELGILLTTFLLLPWIVAFTGKTTRTIMFETNLGASVIPILLFFFVRAMVSSDLTESIRLFVFGAFIINKSWGGYITATK